MENTGGREERERKRGERRGGEGKRKSKGRKTREKKKKKKRGSTTRRTSKGYSQNFFLFR